MKCDYYIFLIGFTFLFRCCRYLYVVNPDMQLIEKKHKRQGKYLILIWKLIDMLKYLTNKN